MITSLLCLMLLASAHTPAAQEATTQATTTQQATATQAAAEQSTAPQAAPAPKVERTRFELAPCSESTTVRTTWLAERRATVRTTSNGAEMPSYSTHEERHLDRSLAVLDCRYGIPVRLQVRYGDAFDRRLDQDPAHGDPNRDPAAPEYTIDRSPLAGRNFEIVQTGEAANVLVAEASPAPPSLAALVLQSESVVGGAVPLPGDSVARALAANVREKGVVFDFDAEVARNLLAGDETAQCVATATFLGHERTPEGRTQARFELQIRVHEAPEGGLERDADLRGFLIAEPSTGRPLQFQVEGSERKLAAVADTQNATEIEIQGTWRVRRTWEWR